MWSIRSRSARWNTLAGLGVLILFAFGLRLYRLGEPSLWNDEGLTLYRARASWEELLRGQIVLQGLRPILTIDNHPPLYFVVLKIWIALAGDTEFALRFPSVWASILIIPLAWTVWKQLREPAAAWVSALLLAVSPLYLWYGQEARMYTLLALESLFLFRLWLSFSGNFSRTSSRFVMIAAMISMLLTHYTSILLLFSLWLWALLQPQRSQRRMALISLPAFVVLGLFLPFLYQRLLSGPERDYRFIPFLDLLIDIFRSPAFGTSFPYRNSGLWPIQWAWVGAMGIGSWHLLRHKRSVGFLFLFSFFGPTILLYGLSHIKPLYQNIRHLFLITPMAYLLASLGFAFLIRRSVYVGIPISAFVCAGMLLSDGLYFSEPYPLKEDWRGALAWTNRQVISKDLVILQDLTLTPLARYYYHGSAPLLLIGREGEEQEGMIQALEASTQRPERIWLITGLSQEDLFRPNQALPHWLSANSLYLMQKVFPSRNIWVRVLVYDLYAWDRQPSPEAIPVDLRIGSYLRLRWIEGPELEHPILRWWFFWEKGSLSSLNLWLDIRLIDGRGEVWAREVQPIWPSFPPDRWPESRLVRQQVRMRLPPGLPPGIYRLRVEAFDLDRRIPANGASGWESPSFFLEGYTDPAGSMTPGVRSMGGVQLLAARPVVDPPYFPGLGVPVHLLWRAEADPPRARSMALFWQQGATRRLLFRGELGPSFFPSDRWKAGQVVAQPLVLPLPPDLRGYGQVRLVLYDERGEPIPWETPWPFYRQGYPVFTLSLSPWPVRHKPIPLNREGRACFEGWICLDRYEIQPEQAAPGQTVEVRLAWHVRRRPERPGVVFVHLSRRPDQPPLTTGDAPPQGGQRPILTWEPGEYVEDIHRLQIPEDLPPGPYGIFIGWYSEEGRWRAVDRSGARYPLDAVPLGEIEVRP
ncbi:glycosyltransferase family 39 protein [Thermoflexus sp.]|uniref:glycosyltransferase family 39 protein n=1 Tax=Thermoflexus sp. TaxID=1969742 RepID=UPI00175D9814|nr:glycosyltransferase family 39 protein [Thermoflexus sp.]